MTHWKETQSLNYILSLTDFKLKSLRCYSILKLRHLTMASIDLPFSVGVISAFVVGILSISFLLRYLKTSNFGLFVGYRFIIGFIVIGLVLAGH